MRCAACGGEIDNETMRCKRCGECWGGGNYSVAQSLMRDNEDDYIPPESRTLHRESKLRDFFCACAETLKTAYFAIDDALSPPADRLIEFFRSRQPVMNRASERESPRRDRAIVYVSVLLIIAILLLSVFGISSSCAARSSIKGRWSLAGSEEQSRVVMEFSSGNRVKMYIGAENDRHLYKEGSYVFKDDVLKIDYSDGDGMILEVEISGDTAVFRNPATGRQQTYLKH